MAWFRRSKFIFNSFQNFTSRIKPPNPFPESTSENTQNTSRLFSFVSTKLGFQFGPKQPEFHTHLVNYSSRRFYFVDARRVSHFKPRGFKKWFQKPRNVLIVVVVSAGVVITVYFGHLETIPYTHRTHFVLLSKEAERRIGEAQFEEIKKSFRGKILPAIHPDSVRVRLIAKDVIDALKRGLRQEKVWSDPGYAAESHGMDGGDGRETVIAMTESYEGKWSRDDEILDDKWVRESRTKGKQPSTGHLEGLKWEVLVVNEPDVNAFCLPGGKIVVFTGLLDHIRANAEIGTIIGHEVGHCVARHAAEGITKNLWFAILQLVLYQFVMPDLVHTMSTLLLKLPFSRRMEMEADYIGLLLMASAGYDPRVAPQVYMKLDKVTGESALKDYLSTHPSGKTRAKLLAQAQVMEEALSIYREAISGRTIEGFL